MKILNVDNITIGIAKLPPFQRSERRLHEQAAVQSILETILGNKIEVGHMPSGAPYIVGYENIFISISHSATQAVVAISRQNPVGIDTETLRPQLERVRDKYLSPREQHEWNTPEKLLRAWCIKEAAYKIAGTPGLELTNGIILNNQDSVELSDGRRYIYKIIEETPLMATVIVFPDNQQ